MSESKDHNPECKVIAGFVSLASHLIMHQIDVTSAHFAVAFNIPIHNISIYFSKLFSFRCLLIALGSAAEFIISFIPQIQRKYSSLSCLGFVLILRLIFLCLLKFSSQLSYHVYIILSIEAFFFGYFHCSVLAITPEHSVVIVFCANISRLFVFLIQILLDISLYTNPLRMIKLQSWLCFVFTSIAFGSWCYYHHQSHCTCHDPCKTQKNGPDNFIDNIKKSWSPFLMFFAGSMFKDFLYPGVLPYALLERDKCHAINMVVPIFSMLGPSTLFIMELNSQFTNWNPDFNWFWLMAVPMVVIFIYCLLAIHTRIPSARRIANSKWLVLFLTLVVIHSNSYLDPLSFSGVAKSVNSQEQQQSQSENKNSLITFHAILALFMRFVFAKLSVGYNDVRVSLGYHLPRFRPEHKMSNANAFWYIFRNTFRRAYRDTISDFGINIKRYL